MKIEKIKKQKNGKYKLELDNQESIVVYDEVILKHNLLFSKNIDTTLMNEIEKDNDYYQAYNRAVRYIGTKMRSTYELREYLEKIGTLETMIEQIISDLNKKGLLNDEQYIKAYISDRIHLSNYGPYKIKEELLKHKIDEEKINVELQKYNEQIFIEKIKKIIIKKNSTNTKYTTYIWKQKLLAYALTLGYSREMILPLLEEIVVPCDEIIDKEYQSLCKKLSKKYEGSDFENQLRNRLLRKGFSLEEINEKMKNG